MFTFWTWLFLHTFDDTLRLYKSLQHLQWQQKSLVSLQLSLEPFGTAVVALHCEQKLRIGIACQPNEDRQVYEKQTSSPTSLDRKQAKDQK